MEVRIKLPDYLKHVFDDRGLLTVKGTGSARKVLLLWAWANGAVWVSRRPRDAQALLEEQLLQWPHVSAKRVEFRAPNELSATDCDFAVVEDPAHIDGAVAWVKTHVRKQARLLEISNDDTLVTKVDAAGLSLDERLALLEATRTGRSFEYEEHDLVASVCRESLYVFMKEFWSTIVAEPFVDNWHIRIICDAIQETLEPVFEWREKESDLIINVSPGSTKSICASVMTTPWTWTRMPSFRLIGGSYAHNLAMDLSRKSRQVIQSAKYQSSFPIRLRDDQNAKSHFVNEKEGMRMGVGTGGVAGFHSHANVIDDPLDPNKSHSEVEIKAANTWVNEGIEQRKVDQRIAPTILIMQRLNQADPTGEKLRIANGSGSVRHICIPAELTDDVKPRSLAKFYVDGLMDPRRLPATVLAQKRKLGQYLYAAQYLQSPSPPSGGMFKWERIKIRNSAPTVLKQIVRYWDKAGTEGAGAFTAGVKMSVDDHGEYWVLDVTRGQWESNVRESVIKQRADIDGLRTRVGIEQEPGSGGKDSAIATKKNLRGFSVLCERPTGDKIWRADAFSVAVNDGHVNLVLGDWNLEYLEELRYFPESRFKDQVDASSGAFRMLTQKQIRVGGGYTK